MYRNTMHRALVFSPRKSEEMLKFNTFAGQRNKRPPTVSTYAELITAERFGVATVAIAIMPDGTRMLVDGQHTLSSSVMSQKSIKVSYQEYTCENEEDLWRLYAIFNTELSRTEADIMRSLHGLFKNPELNHVPTQILQLCSSALLYLRDGTTPLFSVKPQTKTIKPALVDTHPDEVFLIKRYADLAGTRPKVAVVVAILATHRKNPAKAQEFWDRVIGGDKLERGTPQYNLHKFLTSPVAVSSNCGQTGHTIRYKTCIAWWNSFIEGTPRTVVKLQAMKSLPEVKGSMVHGALKHTNRLSTAMCCE